ncbi:hypothetical protein DSLASN_32340 [Desulfoluna limicola]|uniref:Serine protease n=1 Tax=Desulfoluna limicola TaxID=2810562 RepID=A0ABM7PJM4_9BACT|nr:trypsin-like peptidase domain-containing protein [Desulfoluna limicola]BCS97602.1 hypothetical protein DSLASN_32340 [Desulfoluna limicola]
MNCPKCGHEQHTEVECDACGIVFEKYLNMLELFSHPIFTVSDRAPSLFSRLRPPRWVNVAISLTLVWAILNYGFRLGTATDTPECPALAQSTLSSRSGLSKQRHHFKKPGNVIESCRRATVFIETPWGSGSGFFIDASCRVITNKNLLTIEEDELNNLRQKVQVLEHTIADKHREIERADDTVPFVGDPMIAKEMPGNNVGQILTSSALTMQYAQLKSRLAAIEEHRYSPTFTVTLFDDTAFTVTDATFSETHDLALLQLNKQGCPCLKPGKSEDLNTGQPVFTIGNPLGPSPTVTYGIVSGKRTHDEHTYIQTDGPGNSGGPLINQKGHVVGISTMLFENVEGIGVAIPIEVAMNEFQVLNR